MALQQAPILIQPAYGIQGEQAFNNPPLVALPWNLNSAQASYNVIGATAYTKTGQQTAAAGQAGSNSFAGILVNPKNQVNYNGNLSPTMSLPNGILGTLCTAGAINVFLTNTPTVGQQVVFDNTTGALSSVAAGSVLASGKSWANATVYAYDGSGSGLATIIVSPQVPVSYVPAS